MGVPVAVLAALLAGSTVLLAQAPGGVEAPKASLEGTSAPARRFVQERRESERMRADERSTLDALARRANETEFGVSLAQWVAENYPPTIAGLEQVAQRPELRDILGAIPELKTQLADAQKILQSAAASGVSGQPTGTGSVAPVSSKPKSD